MIVELQYRCLYSTLFAEEREAVCLSIFKINVFSYATFRDMVYLLVYSCVKNIC